MGGNGVAAALRLAKLEHLIGNYPPDTLDRDFSFEDFAAVNQAIVEMYGPQGARGLCVRAGRASLRHAVAESGLMAILPDPAFQLLPVGARVKVGLNTLAEVLSKLSYQEGKLEERAGDLVCVVETCPECWGQISHEAICHGTNGMLQEALRWLTDTEAYGVTEVECVARGDSVCAFLIFKEPEEATHGGSDGRALDAADVEEQ